MSNNSNTLAIDRTVLANQRTLLAFVRTSFYFIGMGLSIIGVDSFHKLKFLAVPLFIISVVVIVIGFMSYFHQKRNINLVLEEK